MNNQGFQQLKVWQKAHKLVLEIYKETIFFPKEERYSLTNQIRRASSSVCANLAEGHKKSSRDFSRYIDIAQGSLEETKYHLILSKDLGYCKNTIFCSLFASCEEIGKMLFGLQKKLNHYTNFFTYILCLRS